jgi:hypothetical protein
MIQQVLYRRGCPQICRAFASAREPIAAGKSGCRPSSRTGNRGPAGRCELSSIRPGLNHHTNMLDTVPGQRPGWLSACAQAGASDASVQRHGEAAHTSESLSISRFDARRQQRVPGRAVGETEGANGWERSGIVCADSQLAADALDIDVKRESAFERRRQDEYFGHRSADSPSSEVIAVAD